MAVHNVFPGIDLIYNSVHTDCCCLGTEAEGNLSRYTTAGKGAFKGVYGVPVRSYNRILKMQSAALKLIHTDFTVLAIANECGYDNASKFASAFRKVMGESPAEYRKVHGVDGNALPGCVGLEQSCVPLEWKEAEGQNIINKDL